MSYFKKSPIMERFLSQLAKDQRWLITINADPDAMASAMALKRIASRKTGEIDIAAINEIKRPDNLAMIRYTHLHMLRLNEEILKNYTHFAMVDSQPSHSPQFEGIDYSIIIDHHPLATEARDGLLLDIRPDYGSVSTIMTESLHNLHMPPGQLLATALQMGIRTDTASFQRHCGEVDIRAYQYLSKFAKPGLLNRIIRSEYHEGWLPYFGLAVTSLHRAGTGHYVYMGKVPNPDLLVVIADFFTRVYEIRWIAVAGYCESDVIVVFRSDGYSADVGKVASLKFGSIGSAGGHKTMARAEFPLATVGNTELKSYIYKILNAPLPRKTNKKLQSEAAEAE